MLNKELLMVESESLEPVLSIYISPNISQSACVSGKLSSGEALFVKTPGETTFKFSEIDLTASIEIIYFEDVQISTPNLMPEDASYSGRAKRVPAAMLESFLIRDVTQPASIVIEE